MIKGITEEDIKNCKLIETEYIDALKHMHSVFDTIRNIYKYTYTETEINNIDKKQLSITEQIKYDSDKIFYNFRNTIIQYNENFIKDIINYFDTKYSYKQKINNDYSKIFYRTLFTDKRLTFINDYDKQLLISNFVLLFPLETILETISTYTNNLSYHYNYMLNYIYFANRHVYYVKKDYIEVSFSSFRINNCSGKMCITNLNIDSFVTILLFINKFLYNNFEYLPYQIELLTTMMDGFNYKKKIYIEDEYIKYIKVYNNSSVKIYIKDNFNYEKFDSFLKSIYK